jgi:hypothetical protein
MLQDESLKTKMLDLADGYDRMAHTAERRNDEMSRMAPALIEPSSSPKPEPVKPESVVISPAVPAWEERARRTKS